MVLPFLWLSSGYPFQLLKLRGLQVEDRFRQSNDEDLVSVRPIRHWTDSKIRLHLFTCVVAMTYLRRLELKLAASPLRRKAIS